jgi:hypothetical protein
LELFRDEDQAKHWLQSDIDHKKHGLYEPCELIRDGRAGGSGLTGNGGVESMGLSESVKLDQVWGFVNSEDEESENSGYAMTVFWSML